MRFAMLATVALVAIGSAACSGRAESHNYEAFFGPTIEPPQGLAKIQPGMTVAQAKKLVPALREDHHGVRDHLELTTGVADVRLQVRVDQGNVTSIVAIVNGQSGRDLLTKAWGEPEIAKDALGQPEITWASETTGWKVKLDCLERNCLVEYVPYHVLTGEFFGPHVVPPDVLSNLKIGMKLADAHKIAPAQIDVRAGINAGVDSVREFVSIDDKKGTVKSIYLNVPQHTEAILTDAWGPGLEATELGKNVLVWPDPTTGWRATLRDALGSSHDLAFDNYQPSATLLGEGVEGPDAVPVLGMTADQVKAQFPTEWSQQGKNDIVLTLLPTEWERTATKVTLELANGKVHAMSFSIPFRAHPTSKDSLQEIFVHKWGEAREKEDDGKTILVFNSDAEDAPRVEITDDTEHGAWQIDITKR
ncbi:MAG TPA: hypothetical protein VGM90_06030 [Kofleriaceae bacterium]|jgi:hypothetical protein